MKRMMIVVLSVLANCAFALTETVDGITWNYYVKNGYAMLEHPDTRKQTTCPKPVHAGVLPPTLKIPAVLGGYEVRTIGIAAFQIPEDSDVQKIIVPETVKKMAYESAFLGKYSSTDIDGGGRYLYTVFRFSFINCDVVFLGDCPSDSSDSSWDIVSGGTTYRSGCRAGSRTYGASIFWGDPMFGGKTVYIVDGTSGWSTKYCGGTTICYAAKLDFVPADGIVLQDKLVEILCANDSAKIYYTIDGNEPTPYASTLCRLYNGPLQLDHKAIVKALAYVKAYPAQITYAREFALGKALEPIAVSSAGVVFNWSGNIVTLVAGTEDSEIHYTLDGSEPTEQSTLYVAPFAINDTTTVRAKAFKEDWFESETVTTTFTREWYIVAQPIIEPSGMTFGNVSQEVSMSCETDGATILFTTDGSDPAVNGREYKRPFDIYQSCTVRAVAVKYDWKDSEVATATFTRADSLSEAANLYGYTMEADETHPWTVVTDVSHDGVSSVRSGAIGNGGTTYLQASVRKAGTVSFWWKAQCEDAEVEDDETYWYDYGAFLVDGVVMARIAGHDTGWQFVSVDVAGGGKHTLRWEYSKDGATSYAPDCVWLDQVQWAPADGSGFTMTSPEPVPYSWLSTYGFGGMVADFETAANAPSGKHDGGGKALSVWQDYVAGTDPTNLASRLTAKIEMRGSEPIVTWEPDLNENGTKSERLYKIYGSETLDGGGEWQYPTNSLHRFFKVTVEMP